MNPVYFWTIATVMVVIATLAVAAPLFWVRAAGPEGQPRRRLLAVLALTAGIPLVSLGIYAKLGSPALLGAASAPIAADAAPHLATGNAVTGSGDGAAAGQPASTAGGDMNAAIARLEAKLAKSPNDPAGWQLLAQSYDFVGRPADAASARARAGGAASPSPTSMAAAPAMPPMAASAGSLLGAAASMPGAAPAGTAPAANSDPLVEKAEKARRERDFPQAVSAFKQLAARGGMTADLWADYADAVAAVNGGKLAAGSAPLIAQALALDPQHPKALWLLGSLQEEQRNASAALATWQKLAQLLPPDSADGRLIAAKLEETRQALGVAPAAAMPAAGASIASAVAVTGQVQLDPRYKAKVPADTVLFIFAKSVDQPGPPLAVFRTTAAAWPVQFALDDSMAMRPNRRLSDFQKVTIEARLSRTGSANPSPGDLRGAAPAINPRQNRAPLRIVINEEVR